MNIWPAFLTAYQNGLSLNNHSPDTKAKISGLLKKFRSYKVLCQVCVYLDILEKTSPVSLVFEGEGLLPGEVEASIKRTISELEDMNEVAGKPGELLDSHLLPFQVRELDGELILRPSFVKAGDMLKKPMLRE